MSTRALIGVYVTEGRSDAITTYHHCDGYPSGLGVDIVNIYHDVFIQAFVDPANAPDWLKSLFTQEEQTVADLFVEAIVISKYGCAGWASLNGDFSREPCWSEEWTLTGDAYEKARAGRAPKTFYGREGEDHPDKPNTEAVSISQLFKDSGAAWAYIFRVDGTFATPEVDVYCTYGNRGYVGTVDLTDRDKAVEQLLRFESDDFEDDGPELVDDVQIICAIEINPKLHLTSKAREVLEARQQRDALKARLKTARERFEARLASFQEQLRELEYEVAMQETMAKDLALEIYERDGNKDVGCGLKVRVVKTVTYDPEAARSWALTSAEDLLTLDAKRFEKGVRDGVITSAPAEVVETPQVTIASDLAKALVESEPEPADEPVVPDFTTMEPAPPPALLPLDFDDSETNPYYEWENPRTGND